MNRKSTPTGCFLEGPKETSMPAKYGLIQCSDCALSSAIIEDHIVQGRISNNVGEQACSHTAVPAKTPSYR